MSWKVVTHSAIGSRHLLKGQPCQDYGSYCLQGNLILGAVSDGAGSAKHSDVGSKIAVESYLSIAQEHLNQHHPNLGDLQCPEEIEFETLCASVAQAILSVLKAEAEQSGFALRELGCTLIGFIASPHWIAAMQIGDGFIVIQQPEQEGIQLLFQPDKGEFINETLFITSQGALDQIQVVVKPGNPQFICAATDGLEKVAIRYHDWQPHFPFFKPFIDCLSLIPEVDDQHQYVQTFLESDRLNAKTDDDKTLLLCLCSSVEEPLCAS